MLTQTNSDDYWFVINYNNQLYNYRNIGVDEENSSRFQQVLYWRPKYSSSHRSWLYKKCKAVASKHDEGLGLYNVVYQSYGVLAWRVEKSTPI